MIVLRAVSVMFKLGISGIVLWRVPHVVLTPTLFSFLYLPAWDSAAQHIEVARISCIFRSDVTELLGYT
jgi:hypothetical protein